MEHYSTKQAEEQVESSTDNGLADAIMKYKGLLDAGAITQEEFNILKQKLIQGNNE